jgi:TP901 family phage tail tape measure protein
MSTPTQTILELLVKASGAETITPIVKGLEDLVKVGGEGAPRAKELLDEFAKFGEQSKLIDTLVKEKAALVELGDKMNEVGGRFNKLQAEIAATATPSVALQRSFAATQKSLQDLGAQFGQHEATIARTGNALKAAGVDTDHLDVAQRGVQAAIAGTAVKAVELGQAVKGAGTEIKGAGEKSEVGAELFGKLHAVMIGLISGAVLLEAALKAIEFGKDSIKGAEEVEVSLSRVKALARGAADEFAGFAEATDKASKAVNVTSKEAADGLGALVSQGLAANDAIAALIPTLQLAKIAQIDNGTAAKLVADSLKAFNLPASDAQTVVDQLATASHGAAGGLGAMATAAAALAPEAKALGLSFTQTVGILGTLSAHGVDTEKSLKGLQAIFADLGKDASPLRVALLGLGDGSKSLSAAVATLSKNTPEAKEALDQLDGSARRVILALSQAGPGAVDAFTESLKGTQGEATRIVRILDDNLGGAFKRFSNSFGDLGEALAEPVLKPFADEFFKLAGQLDEFAKSPDFEAIKKSIGDMAREGAKALDELIQNTDWKGFATSARESISEIAGALKTVGESAKTITTVLGVVGKAGALLNPTKSLLVEFGDAAQKAGIGLDFFNEKAKDPEAAAKLGELKTTLGTAAESADKAAIAMPGAAAGIGTVGAAAKEGAPPLLQHADAMTQNADSAGQLVDPLSEIADHFKLAGDNAGAAVSPMKAVDEAVRQVPGPLQIAKEKLLAASAAFGELVRSGNATPAAIGAATAAFVAAQNEVAKLGAAAVIAGGEMKAAFTGLGIASQQQLNKARDDFKSFFEAVNKGSADTAEGLADRQKAFLRYAEAALAAAATGTEGTKANVRANLEAQASTLGLTDALKILESQSSRTGVALLDAADHAERAATRQRIAADKAGAAAGNAALAASIAGDKAAEATGKAERGFTEWGDSADAAALKTQGITANTSHANEAMEALAGGIANARKAFLGVSEAAAHTYDVILKGAFDLGHSDDGSGFDRVARAMQTALTKTTILVSQQRSELASMVATVEEYGQAGTKNFDATSIAAGQQLQVMRQTSQAIKDGTFQFGILGQQDLGGLQQALDSAIARTQSLIDKANEAARAFEDAGRQLQDQLDQELGNQQAIEDRRFQDQLDNLKRLAEEAGKSGSRQLGEDIARATKLHELKLKQIEEEKKKSGGGGSNGSDSGSDAGGRRSGGDGNSSGGGGGIASSPPDVHFHFTITDSVVATEEGLNKLADRTTRKVIQKIAEVRRRTTGPLDNVFK